MKTRFSNFSRTQNGFLLQMLFAAAFTTVTSGTFLSGLAVYLGAGDVLVSYIGIIANVCGVFVLLFAPLLARTTHQKGAAVALAAVSKLVTLSLVLIPLYAEKALRLPLFVCVVLIAFTLQGLSTTALNHWLASYTPGDRRGKYISLRQTISLLVTVLLSLLAGRFLDSAPDQYLGFAALFAGALAAGAAEVVVLLRTRAACTAALGRPRHSLQDILAASLGNRPFLRYVLFIFTFYLVLYIADSFTFVLLFRYLQLPYTTITRLQMLMTLPQVFLLGVWGKLSDRFGHKAALSASIWFFAGETFFLFLTSTRSWAVTVPIAFLISSAANSGFALAVFNRRYELIRPDDRILCDSFFNAVIGLAFLTGPFLGGLLRDWILSRNILSGVMEFPEIRLLYAVSAAGVLCVQTLHLLAERRTKGPEGVRHGLA